MEFEQETGGEPTGDPSCHEQITDPGEQRRGIGGGCQALFEGLQLLDVAATPQGIDQGVFSWPGVDELGAGHREMFSYFSVMALAKCLCHPLAYGEAGTKKAQVGLPRLGAFSSIFLMIWIAPVKGCRQI